VKPYFRKLHGPSDWGWVLQYLPLKQVEDTTGIVAIDLERNATVAVCVMDTWTRNSVQAHIIVENPWILRHGFIEECTDFAFNVVGVKLAIGLVPDNNEKALALDKHIGFTEIARIPDAMYDGVGTVIMTMRREDCRYYNPLPMPVAATG